jgi:hypothetical protein
MKKSKLVIANGNPTLLVWDLPISLKNKLIKQNLGDVEQVGFVTRKTFLPSLEMMGNELCINATIALAKLLGGKGSLYTSGVGTKIRYTNDKDITSISLSLSFVVNKNIILLPGIGFMYLTETIPTKKRLKELANRYNLPAFGAITFQNNVLQPYVYVKNTNSLFKESACGSGSIALNILKGVKNIVQPTGEIITVTRKKNYFTISAKVKELPLRKTEKNDTLREIGL